MNVTGGKGNDQKGDKVTEPDAARREELIETIASHVRRLGLEAPGIAFLEASKPLSFLGSQCLLFLQPLLSAFVSHAVTDDLAGLLEDRAGIERLIQRLESSKG